MTRKLGWRPDRFHAANCDDCRTMPAVTGGRCVQCDYKHWQELRAAEAAQECATATGAQAVSLAAAAKTIAAV